MIKNFKIGSQKIDYSKKPYVIAEISANHGGSLNKCYKLIDFIVKAGADAVKIQTYKPDSITIKCKRNEFLIKNLEDNWDNTYLYDIYKKSCLPWSWIEKLKLYCKKKKIFFFSSVFDEEGLLFLKNLNLGAYKISSFEFNHYPLIKSILKTKKPIIFSTGVSDFTEIKKVNNYVRKFSNNYAILHCVSSYPAKIENYNLNILDKLKKDLKVIIGISDHTEDNILASLAASRGAKIFEKHVKLDDDITSTDSHFSLPVSKLKDYIYSVNAAWKLSNKNVLDLDVKKKYSKYKRSIYIIKDLKKNQKIEKKDLKIIRPANGLDPIYFENVIGKTAIKNLKAPRPLKLNDIKEKI